MTGSLGRGPPAVADEALLRKAGAVDPKKMSTAARISAATNWPREAQRIEKRLAAIQAAKARLEAAQRARDDEPREPGPAIPGAGGPTSALTASPSRRRRAISLRSREQIEDQQRNPTRQMAVDGEHQIRRAAHRLAIRVLVSPEVWGRTCGGTGRCGLLQRAGLRELRGIDAHVALGQVPGGGRPGPAP